VALAQNSLELTIVAFLDKNLACFGVHVEVLIDQGKKFIGTFEALYTKTLIDH